MIPNENENMANVQALQKLGWYLTASGIEQCAENGRVSSAEDIVKFSLNLDLKEIGERHLPEALGKNKIEHVDGPFVLQIQRVRNVCSPKDQQLSHTGDRLLRLALTDGHNSCAALELEQLSNLSVSTPPGTKLKLLGRVPVSSGFLLLDKHNCKVLGGRVEKLVDNWELKRSLAAHSRSQTAQGGPPPFVPFGQRRKDDTIDKKGGKFKSLENKTEKTDDSEFEQLRQATIAKLQDVKIDSKSKNYGTAGVNKVQQDKDVAKIVEMGFTADQANSALKQSGGNLQDAIDSLLNGPSSRGSNVQSQGGRRNVQYAPGRDGNRNYGDDRRGARGSDKLALNGGKGPPDRGGRGRRGRQDEDAADEAQSRPSGPATLFDFLTDKIPADAKKGQSQPSSGKRDQTEMAPKSTYTAQADSEVHKRITTPANHQNLPPRLVKKQQQRDSGSWNQQNPNSNSSSSNRWQDSSDTRNSHSQTRSYNSLNNPRVETRDDGAAGSQYDSHRRQYKSDNYLQNEVQGNSAYHSRDSASYHNRKFNKREYSETESNKQSYAGRQNHDNWGESQRTGNRNQGPNTEYRSHGDGRQRQTGASRHGDGCAREQSGEYVPPREASYDGANHTAPNSQGHRGEAARAGWKEGDFCMAPYSQDQQYYRARIQRMKGRTCTILFLDYGNEEDTSLSDLRPQQKVWEPSSVPDQSVMLPPGLVLHPQPPVSYVMAFPSPPIDAYPQQPDVEYSVVYQQQPLYPTDQFYEGSPG